MGPVLGEFKALAAATNTLPSAEEATEIQWLLGADAVVQVAPESVEM
jgi:hypothetical protein